MSPRPQHDRELALVSLALLLLAIAVAAASRRVAADEEERLIHRNRLFELEEQLEVRTRQLDGALEKITEIKNGVDPAAD